MYVVAKFTGPFAHLSLAISDTQELEIGRVKNSQYSIKRGGAKECTLSSQECKLDGLRNSLHTPEL
jgi:hypothetical protein